MVGDQRLEVLPTPEQVESAYRRYRAMGVHHAARVHCIDELRLKGSARQEAASIQMEHVRAFLHYLVDVAGPPDQPAFLAPVSATGLEFSSSVCNGKDGDLVRSFRLLSSLDNSASRREHDQ